MAVAAFTSLCSTYSLCSFSPFVSILLIVLNTVSLSISVGYNASRSKLSSMNGFPYLQLRSLKLYPVYRKLTLLREPANGV